MVCYRNISNRYNKNSTSNPGTEDWQ